MDTNALLYATLSSSELSQAAQQTLRSANIHVLVSAASAWEIATKVRIGRLPSAVFLSEHFEETMRHARFQIIPIAVEEALLAGRMAGEHRDPFDRMIAAQALTRGVPVISIDTQLDVFGVQRIW